MSETRLNYAGGEWIGSANVVAAVNPSDTSEVVNRYAHADAELTEIAVEAAQAAFPAWSQTTAQQRFDLLDRIGATILERREALGLLLAREEGKVLTEAMGEVIRAGHIFKFFAGEALRVGGEIMPPVRPGVGVEITREPVGVIGLIAPWNFPIAIPAWKAAPALAFGNCVVLKPAEIAPGCAHALAEITAEAGVPAGVFNLLIGSGATVGASLVRSRSVDAISFTGSIATGRAIAAEAITSGKKIQLEMGGKNPWIVLDDANLEVAVGAAINSAFFSTGQRCTAASRIVVTEAIHDRFVAAMTAQMSTLKVGHALDPSTHIGPVVNEKQLAQDLDYVAIGQREGARLIGGEVLKRPTDGYFLAPALFTETRPDMRINQEEIFGPIASVIRVKDYEEALAVANQTEFGLSAGICTTSLAKAAHFKRHAKAGIVTVNLPTAGVDYHAPFGGRKSSSWGPREQGCYAAEFYTILKTAYVAA